MKQEIEKKIGRNIVKYTVEGKNPYECQMEAQKLSFYDVEKCDLCNTPRPKTIPKQ